MTAQIHLSQDFSKFRNQSFDFSRQDICNDLATLGLQEAFDSLCDKFANLRFFASTNTLTESNLSLKDDNSLSIDKGNDEVFNLCEHIANIKSNGIKLETLLALQRLVRINQIHKDLECYVNSLNNPKFFFFYLKMLDIAFFKRANSISFNLKQIAYHYNNCTKTIKLWLDELCDLGLVTKAIKGKKDKEIFFVTLKSYKQSKAFKLSMTLEIKQKQRLLEEMEKQNQQKLEKSSNKSKNKKMIDSANSNVSNNKKDKTSEKTLLYPQKPFEATIYTREKLSNFPLRFFRDMELYLRNLARQGAKKGLVYEFEEEKYVLSPNHFNDLRKSRDIVFEFQSVENCQKYISIPYHFLSNATPPLSIEPYHQNIFKKQIREALKTLLVRDFNLIKGKQNEQVA